MKKLNNYISEKLNIKNIKVHQYEYHPKTKDELKELVDKLIEERGNNANLNDIDTSEITDMYELFFDSNFTGDISEWDVRNVKDMSYMFHSSKFTGENGDISKWDVSNVKNMTDMFFNSPLENNPPKWYKE